MNFLFFSVLCHCFLNAIVGQLNDLPDDINRKIVEKIDDSRSIASLSKVSRYNQNFIRDDEELSFHQDRINHYWKPKVTEELVDKSTKDVGYLCLRKSPIELGIYLPLKYESKIINLATALNNIKNCQQYPVLYLKNWKNFATADFVINISPRIKVIFNPSTYIKAVNSEFEIDRGIDSIDLSNNAIAWRAYRNDLPQSLRSLNLRNTGYVTTSKIMQKVPDELKDLDLSDNQVYSRDPYKFPKGLKSLKMAKTQILSQKLPTFPIGLEYLDFSDNDIGDQIGDLPKLPDTLKKLYLIGNSITYEHRQVILESQGFQSLTSTRNGFEAVFENGNKLEIICR